MSGKRRTREQVEKQRLKCQQCERSYSKGSFTCQQCIGLIKPHFCPDCGRNISQKGNRCSSCARKFLWATGEMYDEGRYPKGADNPNWKGGRHKTAGGYIVVYKPEHPRASKAGYVLEHIVIWEEIHGTPLPKGWIIHHLNGIKADNQPVNLQALPNKKHYLLLQAKAKRIQELEALLNNQHQLL